MRLRLYKNKSSWTSQIHASTKRESYMISTHIGSFWHCLSLFLRVDRMIKALKESKRPKQLHYIGKVGSMHIQ